MGPSSQTDPSPNKFINVKLLWQSYLTLLHKLLSIDVVNLYNNNMASTKKVNIQMNDSSGAWAFVSLKSHNL